MERNLMLQKVSSARFITLLMAGQRQALGSSLQNYLLCTAVLERRRRELTKSTEQGLDTLALQRMISRLEASQEAHLRTIRELEGEEKL